MHAGSLSWVVPSHKATFARFYGRDLVSLAEALHDIVAIGAYEFCCALCSLVATGTGKDNTAMGNGVLAR